MGFASALRFRRRDTRRDLFGFSWSRTSKVLPSDTRFRPYLLCLKNSTWRNRFSASAFLLYGPPRFFPFSDNTLYPSFTLLTRFWRKTDCSQPFSSIPSYTTILR
jgi:hypothetical protein